MFQSIPSGEHYNEIERELLRQNKPTSLTQDQLKTMQEEALYKAGYVTFTGYVLTSFDAITLNKWTEELNRTTCIKTREYFKDRRHQEFCIISQQLTPQEISGKKVA